MGTLYIYIKLLGE